MLEDMTYGTMFGRIVVYSQAFAYPDNSISWIMYALHSWRLYHLTLHALH